MSLPRLNDNQSPTIGEPLDNPLYLFNSHCEWLVNNIKSHLLGRVLTIIDSSMIDERQNKAVKELIRQAIWKKEFFSQEFAEVIQQYVEKYNPEMKKYLDKLKIPTVPTRNFFSK